MKRTGSAVWQGGLKDGRGTVSTESGVLDGAQYSFGTRFEDGKGTNPEELLAAAHAGCFSMALSKQIEDQGLKADSINTNASVRLEVPGADAAAFETAANNAKAGCPVSRLFNAEITMEAKLEQ
jgi:lipoyl-dependent peroxiredoxin